MPRTDDGATPQEPGSPHAAPALTPERSGPPAAIPHISLGTWILAVLFLDLLWPIFLLLGWEHVRIAPGITKLTPLDFYDYPISHSLIAALGWSVVFGLAYRFLGKAEPQARRLAAVLLGSTVLGHWVFEVLLHRPDLPLLPDGPYVGLGLWNFPAVALPLEAGLYTLGIAFYMRSTRARDGIGRWGLWALLAYLLAVWLASYFGPPPPDERALAWIALSLWILVPWAWWVDRHRSAVAV